ncbi:EpsG family protein [Pseudomonas sp. BJa5]|uniref:EpsG family protein n=1 Tax=Pseudomonas sp. BJa5 TaxID=2936270 RepID=UPI00255A10E9|nr:EpsG family protein [Pseudomonas sp. BGr12]MDL2419959.1 EpsG family protein [Pseudomonas sp. BGr12]
MLALPVLLVMWMLYGWNFWNGDREGYELYYYTRDTIASWGKEIGYGYLNIFASRTGLSYQGFQIIVALVTLLLVWRYVVKRTLFPFVSLLVYLVCFFPLDFVLVRNFLSFAIGLQAMLVLFENKSYSRLKYALLILLAASIHQSSLIFIIFIAMPLNRVVPLGRFLFLYTSFLCAYVLARYSLPLPASIASHFSYYDTSLKSSLANVAVHVLSVVLVSFAIFSERFSLRQVFNATGRDKELVFLLNLNLFSLFFVVLYFESEIFVRLLRSIIFFNMLHCVNSLFLQRRSYFFLGLYILFFAGYLVLFYIVPVAQFSLLPMLRDNLLWN